LPTGLKQDTYCAKSQ